MPWRGGRFTRGVQIVDLWGLSIMAACSVVRSEASAIQKDAHLRRLDQRNLLEADRRKGIGCVGNLMQSTGKRQIS